MCYIDKEKFYKDMLERFDCVPMLTDHSSALNHDILLDEALNMQSTADVVEVVRCKDCIYRKIHTCAITGIETLFCDYGQKPVAVEPTHYCSYGERKTDNDN